MILKDMQNQLIDAAKLQFVSADKTIVVFGVEVEGNHFTLSRVALELVIESCCITYH